MTDTMKDPFNSLSHRFLIASGQMPDERFFDALIYICRHTPDGAWGFIVNQPLHHVCVGMLLQELELPSSQLMMSTPAYHGGFVRPEAGFVLHTGLPDFSSSFAIGENVCLTTSKDVLKRISSHSLSHFLLCMGFCNWGKGQLDKEVAQGDWLICPADVQILFGADPKDKMSLAYQKLGIDVQKFVNDRGHA